MIERLRGEIFLIENDYVGIDVQGVGYQVYVVNPYQFEEGNSAVVYTHHVVREDAALLYGFAKKEERDLFRSLLAVSGVGPKAALGILSAGSPSQIVSAIQSENITFLTKLPGIGKKTAARLILDLKDKLAHWLPAFEDAPKVQAPDDRQIVIDALTALGYDEKEANQLVEQSFVENQSVEAWIRAALRQKGVR
ncbi:Holliday junction branch migration protein RuvA [Shimazuella alba]|uniref:Holliday junction branch migration complex subunit RuvA n=1 Tax=Shimazuella alba TaxID=2690964 RepID=A0A6I4VVT8_9BACL|nr:Holliday junction branch migration protein RuvA [Shimazuella alba]MXQ55063.1 Holliday junction branch migration protein RuvA [Shimazuella alba]